LPCFERRREDTGQVADILGDEEIVLHEALDMLQSVMRFVTQAFGKVGLPVEAQTVFGALGEEMQMATHRPQQVLAFLETSQLFAREHALLGQLLARIGAGQELGDPEQRMEIAQAALAVLHIGLDEITALARLEMPLVALGELARDESLSTLGGDLLAKSLGE